ncbi:MAG: GNAT family N-acetyltransferase [Oligoflexales bacterium]
MIQLSKITEKEGSALAEWLSSGTWPFFTHATTTREQVMDRIKCGEMFNDSRENFWIDLEATPRVGLLEITDLDSHAPMFSLRFKTQYRRKGIGKKVVPMLVDYVFKTYSDKNRIEAQTREDNVAMRKVFGASLFVKEAYYREAYPVPDSSPVASIAYGILRKDWETGITTPVRWKGDGFVDD